MNKKWQESETSWSTAVYMFVLKASTNSLYSLTLDFLDAKVTSHLYAALHWERYHTPKSYVTAMSLCMFWARVCVVKIKRENYSVWFVQTFPVERTPFQMQK